MSRFCEIVKSKSWPYQQYYIGNKDKEKRRNGDGENYWTGAKSLERYSGQFLRDTMHGVGEYFWRYFDKEGAFFTYEGYFYCNKLHGYGSLSYPDGRVFDGLFYTDIRWGPGIESFVDGRQNVGLWMGDQLLRLAWTPPTYSLILDLTSTNTGRACVDAQRSLMTTSTKDFNENTAKELLIQNGLDAETAEEKWTKLYPKHCTDVTSPVFCHQLFDNIYYGSGKQKVLIEKEKITEDDENVEENKTYFAWNNNVTIKDMMKHAFQLDHQRINTRINMSNVLTESRRNLKAPADHELHCRTLLMASYLGHTEKVVELINEYNVHPNVSDIRGNNVLMYAMCGDKTEIIHFLVEAGANIDDYNDCCCTALNIAIIRYVCAYLGISVRDMTQTLIPELPTLPQTPSLENICEWFMERNTSSPFKSNGVTKNPSKLLKPQKKTKSLLSLRDQLPRKTLTSSSAQDQSYVKGDGDIPSNEDVFVSILDDYVANISEIFSRPSSGNIVSYIFSVNDITSELLDIEMEEQKKVADKNTKKAATVPPKTPKALNEIPQHNKDNAESMNFIDKSENEICQNILSTIVQLLSDGADPGLVRCPQPALFMAVASGSSQLVKELIDHGANANQCYPHVLGYSPLDIVISYQFSLDNLNVIRVLLESGADGKHRIPYRARDSTESVIPGPTLLHAVLAKAVENSREEEIRRDIIELLLTHNCSPIEQFNGRSAIDIAMCKGADVFDVFISHSKVDLNAVINQSKQTILIKMFSLSFFKTLEAKERLEILTNLLLRGADPFRPCQNESDNFDNFFAYARKYLDGLDGTDVKQSPSVSKHEQKVKKNGKSNGDKGAMKQKTIPADIEEYKQALQLVTDSARISYIHWIRTTYVKDIIGTIYKYKHRHWNMILKEIKDKTGIGLWVTPQECLEIWTDLSKRIKKDKTVLKYLLYIVFYCCRYINDRSSSDVRVTVNEKNLIEKEVQNYIRKHDLVKDLSTITNFYTAIKPIKGDNTKYNVCFECCLPLNIEKISCSVCQRIAFCNYECIKLNVDRADCHPCSNNLKKMYFPNSNSDSNFGSQS